VQALLSKYSSSESGRDTGRAEKKLARPSRALPSTRQPPPKRLTAEGRVGERTGALGGPEPGPITGIMRQDPELGGRSLQLPLQLRIEICYCLVASPVHFCMRYSRFRVVSNFSDSTAGAAVRNVGRIWIMHVDQGRRRLVMMVKPSVDTPAPCVISTHTVYLHTLSTPDLDLGHLRALMSCGEVSFCLRTSCVQLYRGYF
jgi:hypothetical protein